MKPEIRSGAVLVALAGLNLLAQRSRLNADIVVPAGAAALLLGARASGVSWEELGLSRRQSVGAASCAVLAAAVTAGAVTVSASLPAASGFREDGRYPDRAAAVRSALVTIPLSVAVPEEVLFRSVLDASLRRHLGEAGAAAVHATAFGLWHALGAADLTHDNAGVGRLVGDGSRSAGASAAAVTVGAVLGTALAGVGFGILRRRTDSILPGVAAHWALNATSALAAGIPRRGASVPVSPAS